MFHLPGLLENIEQKWNIAQLFSPLGATSHTGSRVEGNLRDYGQLSALTSCQMRINTTYPWQARHFTSELRTIENFSLLLIQERNTFPFSPTYNMAVNQCDILLLKSAIDDKVKKEIEDIYIKKIIHNDLIFLRLHFLGFLLSAVNLRKKKKSIGFALIMVPKVTMLSIRICQRDAVKCFLLANRWKFSICKAR